MHQELRFESHWTQMESDMHASCKNRMDRVLNEELSYRTEPLLLLDKRFVPCKDQKLYYTLQSSESPERQEDA